MLINVTPGCFFSISKGIFQGDPISPFLIIIIEETFGRAIKIDQTNENIKGIKVAENITNTTHQHFVDDTIIARISSKKAAKNEPVARQANVTETFETFYYHRLLNRE